MFEKFFEKRVKNIESSKKEETAEEQTKREEQEYYERNKELLDAARKKIAKEVMKKMETPQGVIGNTFLMRFGGVERELAEEISRDVVGIKQFVDAYGDSEKIKEREVFPYLETRLEKVPDQENKWESRLNLVYRKVKERGERERIKESGMTLGSIEEFRDQREAEDCLKIKRIVVLEALDEFGGGFIEEPPREE